MPNLWTVHPPFQIDGNFGTMAGVAEMLIQSHEGLLEILPALPNAWMNGEFKGLIARGNFEISAKWENGKAKFFKILAKAGGPCSVKYKNIASAKIEDGNGKTVTCNVKGTDIIEFMTRAMGEYYFKME